MAFFKINTKYGVMEIEAVPFKFKSPKWLARFRFITHHTRLEDLTESNWWSMTDIATGRSVAKWHYTRAAAKRAGKERILAHGRAYFLLLRRMHCLPNK